MCRHFSCPFTVWKGDCWNVTVLVFVISNEFHLLLNWFSGIPYLNYWQSAYLQEKCRVFLTMASNLLSPHAENVSVYFRHSPSKAWAYIQHLRKKGKILIFKICSKVKTSRSGSPSSRDFHKKKLQPSKIRHFSWLKTLPILLCHLD